MKVNIKEWKENELNIDTWTNSTEVTNSACKSRRREYIRLFSKGNGKAVYYFYRTKEITEKVNSNMKNSV